MPENNEPSTSTVSQVDDLSVESMWECTCGATYLSDQCLMLDSCGPVPTGFEDDEE